MAQAVTTHDPRRNASITLRAVMLLSGVLTIVFIVSFLFSDRGISQLQGSRRRVDDLRVDIRRLQSENARLRSEIDSVKHSTFAVERIAREELGMAKKGEIIYLLPASPKPATSAGH